ncbi:hypothetical protein D3C71_1358780 [compost metagenome]
MCIVVNTGVLTTEDAAHCQRFRVVSNNQRIGVKLSFAAVEQNQGFTLFRHTHHDPAFDTIFIECVHRLTQFEQHVVGHVDNRIDRTNPATTQFFFQPQRGWRFNVDAFHHTTKVAWAGISGFNLNRQRVADSCRNRYDLRCVKFDLVQHRYVARYTDDT